MRTLRECAERIVNGYKEVCQAMTPHADNVPEKSTDNAVRLAVNYLAEHDETPLTEEWLHSIGFRDDRTGTPTIGPLHIRHAHVPKPDSDEEYPPYACVRSFPIPVPKNRSEVLTLLRLLGIAEAP